MRRTRPDGPPFSRRDYVLPLKSSRNAIFRTLKGYPFFETPASNPRLQFGNARALDLEDSSVDLIVTSPPYASNAIDYMRGS